ncbi:MAG: heparinase II/III family protein, partial [Planctomycetes bacterium]|nr:heparinase II/III family protein [Planctomycetota bacterium]
MSFAARIVLLFFVLPMVVLGAKKDFADAILFEDYSPENLWRAANSTVDVVNAEGGEVSWRWHIEGGSEAFLWVSEKAPFHDVMPRYDRFIYDIKFSDGRIDRVWPRTRGLMPSPKPDMTGEWNLFHFTHPHGQWITYQQRFDDPSWNGSSASPIPDGVKIDRSRVLSFTCLPKTTSVTVTLRNCRLVRDRIRVHKPYLTRPVGWPVLKEGQNGQRYYATPYFVKNVSDKKTTVLPKIRSAHEHFDVRVEPQRAGLKPGETCRFEVHASAVQNRESPVGTQETAVVSFVPEDSPELAYRTETFCAVPLPGDFPRAVVLTPEEREELRQKGEKAVDEAVRFWMGLSLEDQTEIPGWVGGTVVWGMPCRCEKCEKGVMKVSSKWLHVECNNPKCDHAEYHTRKADALWIATWCSIHQRGPSPLALGRAYVATGEEKYAQKAISLLSLLARHYPHLPWHHSQHPKGSTYPAPPGPGIWANGASSRWASTPTYGTSFMVQDLARLHNMIADSPSWTNYQRKLVHRGFWIPVATEMAKIVPGLSNMNDIINADLVLAGHSTRDANMIHRGTRSPSGILSRLQDISPDGFSSEGAPLNYHFAAMHEWLPSLKYISNSGLPWGDVRDRVLAALKMPLLRASLAGIAYCTGNSGRAWHGVDLENRMFELAEDIFPKEEWARKRSYSPDPKIFRDAGWAILRSGKKADQQVQIDIDYGRSHGHGDLDRMNLGLQAFGVPLSADPGSSYNFNTAATKGPAIKSMTGPFAHNTVVVDGKHQLRGGGRLICWQINRDYQAFCAEVKGIYPGVKWRRH